MSDDFGVLERVLVDRRSCRGFLPDPVERSTIERLLAAAQHTPSWCNTQPWEVAVFSAESLANLRRAVAEDDRFTADLDWPSQYPDVLGERRRESAWALYDAVGVKRGDREASAAQTRRNFTFFDAPHLAVVSTRAVLGTYGAVDTGLYVQSFLLAAQALGLGACPQAAVARKSELLHEVIGWDSSRTVLCGISFGHPDPQHPSAACRTTRLPLHDTVRWFD